MNTRQDYEHQELDTDGFYYFFINKDVKCIWEGKHEENIKLFAEWWSKYIDIDLNTSLFYKGTRFYFTYKGVKYWESWTWYYPERLQNAIKIAKDLGFTNIQLNYGELD